MIRALLVSASLLFVACGNPTLIDGKQYKTSCTAPTDCAGAFFADQCGACACPNAAISAADKVMYESDRSNARSLCGPQPAIACSQCPDFTLTCTAGVCGIAAK